MKQNDTIFCPSIRPFVSYKYTVAKQCKGLAINRHWPLTGINVINLCIINPITNK